MIYKTRRKLIGLPSNNGIWINIYESKDLRKHNKYGFKIEIRLNDWEDMRPIVKALANIPNAKVMFTAEDVENLLTLEALKE